MVTFIRTIVNHSNYKGKLKLTSTVELILAELPILRLWHPAGLAGCIPNLHGVRSVFLEIKIYSFVKWYNLKMDGTFKLLREKISRKYFTPIFERFLH